MNGLSSYIDEDNGPTHDSSTCWTVPTARGEMVGMARGLVLSIAVLVGACSSRTQGGDAVATAPAAPAAGSSSRVLAPAAAANPTVDEASDEDAAAICTSAFADQRQLYVDAEVEVHPDHEAVFLELCGRLPLALQRCASPLYQLDHESECEAARDEADPASWEAWSGMFDVLRGPEERLMNPLPREATE